jgi:hypothetical protein
VIVVLALLLAGLVVWTIYDQTTGSDPDATELALDPEIEELVADYFAAIEAQDAAAFDALTTDQYATYDAVLAFGGPTSEVSKAEWLAGMEAREQIWNLEVERLGEPFMMGYPDDGRWHVAQAWQQTNVLEIGTRTNEFTSIVTIVDDDGTLRVSRSIQAPHRAPSTE